MYRILNGDTQTPNVKNVVKIAAFLGLDPNSLIIKLREGALTRKLSKKTEEVTKDDLEQVIVLLKNFEGSLPIPEVIELLRISRRVRLSKQQ